VTGIFTAATMPPTSWAVFSNSVISADPPPIFVTFFTGHPMLMSTPWAPSSWQRMAASRISAATLPKSWIERGRSSGQEATSLSAVGLRSRSDRALTRSVVAPSKPPISRIVSRIGRLV